MNDVRLLKFDQLTKERYIEQVLSEMKDRKSNGQKLKALREFLGKSSYFKGVISEDGFDLFVPKQFRAELEAEWFPVDPTFMKVIWEKESKLIYSEKLKDLL
jgi:hypothetical protein